MCALRIMAGEARGRLIKTPPGSDLSVRPILVRIKKSLFDILQPKLSGSLFLDLYAGTGAVGLEAISRGAKKVVFVESEQSSIDLIRKNIAQFGWESKSEVVNADIRRGLGFLRYKFDLIFLGPPYKDREKRPLSLTGLTLSNIVKADILQEKGWIIAQHHKKEPIEVCSGLCNFRNEKYGDSVLSFFEKGI